MWTCLAHVWVKKEPKDQFEQKSTYFHQFSPQMLIFVVTLYQRHVQICRMVSLKCWSLSLLHWFHSAMYKHLKRLIKVNICQAAYLVFKNIKDTIINRTLSDTLHLIELPRCRLGCRKNNLKFRKHHLISFPH